jgi:hypothetical protein
MYFACSVMDLLERCISSAIHSAELTGGCIMATKKTVAKKTKPVTKSATTKTTAEKNTVVKKKAVLAKQTAAKKATTSLNGIKTEITKEQRHLLINETAYLLSLQRSDSSEGGSVDDWLQAEKIVDEKYSVGVL